MYRRALYLMLIVIVLLPISAIADSQGAVIFLTIEPGSRSGAMGHAYTGQVDDAFASWWNLGAMAYNRKSQAALVHSNWFGDIFEDMYYEYLTFNTYMEDIGNIGATVNYMTYGSQQRTDEDGQDLGTFDSYDLALGLTYATQITESSGFGLGFKYIISKLADEGTGQTESGSKGEGVSYAFDFGYSKRGLLTPNLDFGVQMQNVGPSITYINEEQSDPLPLTIRTGFSYKVFTQQYSKLTTNLDFSKQLIKRGDAFYKSIFTSWVDDDFSQEMHEVIASWGVEYTYLDLLSLRTGYVSDRYGEIEGFSFGGGVHKQIGRAHV